MGPNAIIPIEVLMIKIKVAALSARLGILAAQTMIAYLGFDHPFV